MGNILLEVLLQVRYIQCCLLITFIALVTEVIFVSDFVNYKIPMTQTSLKLVILPINACLYNIVIMINREFTQLRIFIIPQQYSQKVQSSWTVFDYCIQYTLKEYVEIEKYMQFLIPTI
jgi:hypothetical protein